MGIVSFSIDGTMGANESEELIKCPPEDICACELVGEAWEAARKRRRHKGLGVRGLKSVACAPQKPPALKRADLPNKSQWRKLNEEHSGETESSKSESAKGQA